MEAPPIPRSSASLAQRTASITTRNWAIPDLELQLARERHVAEAGAFEPDMGELAVGEPWHMVAGADMDIARRQLVPSWLVTARVFDSFFDSSRSRSSMLRKSVLPPKLSW